MYLTNMATGGMEKDSRPRGVEEWCILLPAMLSACVDRV